MRVAPASGRQSGPVARTGLRKTGSAAMMGFSGPIITGLAGSYFGGRAVSAAFVVSVY